MRIPALLLNKLVPALAFLLLLCGQVNAGIEDSLQASEELVILTVENMT